MFRTEINPAPSSQKIGLQTPVLVLGSCFAEVIGKRMEENKFKALSNPFGVIFNPVSLNKVLQYAATKQHPDPDTFLQNQEVFYNYDFHSNFSSLNKEDLISEITESIIGVHHFMGKCKWIILSLGTAMVHARKDTGEIVANCHKIASSHFTKRILEVQEVVESLEHSIKAIQLFNKNCRFILTVSPVRHLKDTLEVNSLSKATLRLAVNALCDKCSEATYFPSYEVLLDDLRDYRFYKDDMLHPTRQAEDYIWNKFAETYFDQETLNFMSDWAKLRDALSHKPFHPESKSHQNFLRKTIEKLESFQDRVEVGHEIETLKKQLT